MAIEYRSPKSVKPTNPFINGSSGSKWGLAELQWLRVDLRPDIPVRGHLLEWIPARGGRTDRSLQLELGRSWSDLQDFEIRKTSSLYSALYEISKPILPPEPQSSPITSTPKSSRSLHGSLIGSSPPLDPRSPSISLQQARELRKRSNPVDYHESQQSSSPNGTDSGNVRVSSSPESDYNASDDEMQYQKESYIQEAARAFVKVLRDITIELTKLDKPENHQMNAETRKFTIAGKSISTLPDGCWRTLNRSYNDVILEVKRKKPSSNKSDILGQEVCHLLSLAFEHRLRQPRKEYSVYLISWHHMQAYISKMRVTDDYLAKVGPSFVPPPSSLRVERSPVLDMKDPDQRMNLARGILGILVATLKHTSKEASIWKSMMRRFDA